MCPLLYLFIYLYLNEATESLIKVVIVADLVRRGSWMSDRMGHMCGYGGEWHVGCTQTHSRSVRHTNSWCQLCVGPLPLGWLGLGVGNRQSVCPWPRRTGVWVSDLRTPGLSP